MNRFVKGSSNDSPAVLDIDATAEESRDQRRVLRGRR
jgi:hypothetical protein